MCFELAEVAFYGLQAIGFNVKRIPSFVSLFQNYEDCRKGVPSHTTLIVTVEEKQYLVELAISPSLRFPIEFVPGQTTTTKMNDYEHFKIVFNQDHYLLQGLIKDTWATLIGFESPLPDNHSQEKCNANF
jgi:arylamine N-acetyltransferase